MTWTAVADEAVTYEFPADLPNLYVAVAYVQNGYIEPAGIWTGIDPESTTWT
jgi:hypothetical protein